MNRSIGLFKSFKLKIKVRIIRFRVRFRVMGLGLGYASIYQNRLKIGLL